MVGFGGGGDGGGRGAEEVLVLRRSGTGSARPLVRFSCVGSLRHCFGLGDGRALGGLEAGWPATELKSISG